MESHTMWSAVSDFFSWYVSNVQAGFSMNEEFIPLLLSNIPLCVYITFCLSVQQLMGLWIVPAL